METIGWGLLAFAALGLITGAVNRTDREKVLSASFSVLVTAALLLWMTGALDRVWESVRRPAMPATETAFIAVLDHWAREYEKAENDVARRPMRAARAADICGLNLREVRDWTGRVAAVHAAGDQAGVDLALTYRVTVGTTNNRLSDALAPAGQQTLIPTGSLLYATLATLRPGTAVRFSGQFFPAAADCLRETRVSESGGMTEPRFEMRLTAISALR